MFHSSRNSLEEEERDTCFRNTSRWTSLAMFSTVPGFDSPKASRRSENEMYVSARAPAIELLKRKFKGDSFSNVTDDMIAVSESR